MDIKWLTCLLFMITPPIQAVDFHGKLVLEGQYFPQPPLQSKQQQNNLSLSIEPEWHHHWNSGRSTVNFVPFYRWDHGDPQRTHLDIRELDLVHVIRDWELQVGISKVFWGVTESQHLVDIINQTDQIESLDGEKKLGQPLVRMTHFLDQGSLDFFLLPYFRERTFASEQGRLRPTLRIQTDKSTYEAKNGQQHVDLAIRLTQSYDQIDWGLSWFQGTSRDPQFKLTADNGQPTLTPHYPQIKQLGLDLQLTGDEWLWKLEAITRHAKNSSYRAMTGGFEYSFYGIANSNTDMGIIMEYHYDTRGQQATSMFQNDLFIGARVALNDVQNTEFLAGMLIDLDGKARSLGIEASRRFGDNIKIDLDLQWFQHSTPNDPSDAFRRDDYLQLAFAWYF